jgi:membrane protein implicated in regulation of membrane protease activity
MIAAAYLCLSGGGIALWYWWPHVGVVATATFAIASLVKAQWLLENCRNGDPDGGKPFAEFKLDGSKVTVDKEANGDRFMVDVEGQPEIKIFRSSDEFIYWQIDQIGTYEARR